MELNVYLSRENWQPEGLCTVRGRSDGTEFSEAEGSLALPKILDVYLDSDGTAHADSMSVLLSDGTESDEFLLHNPPCAKSPVRKGSLSYAAEDGELVFSFPRLAFSGLSRYVIRFGAASVSYLTPARIGEITGTAPGFTGSSPETLTLRFTDTGIAPGETASVSFTLLGGGEELMYRSSVFETSVWTSAKITGCGLYKDDAFYEGGEGAEFDGERFTHEDFRWAVEFRGMPYALKAADFTRFVMNERAAVVKNGLGGSAPTTGKASSGSVRDVLEEGDMIVPFVFYGGV
ncbi:hypothetical protein EP073_11995 [Geovibrio thiophilus]|uniref:Uncharacterized protein n=1 Tax=Geovibrio thiophilus TaxID=139438 RepID=A0A410K1H6_9BACT|nr:hypothetical protein [Geovibrio thiophilus]QAR34098.1 hypothetical protein EP073_11995 [Geovibrio thiophilus]